MRMNRLRVCDEASRRLTHLKGRTGLTPNILCRIGFCLSLNDPTVPNPADFPPDSEREFDRHTLTGPWDRMFVALIKVRCEQDGLDMDEGTLASRFRAHVNRGVLLLYKRVRRFHDLALLMPHEARAALTDLSAAPDEPEDSDDDA